MTVHALAKVNLGLRVLYRRADNFHEIRTIFQTISLADRVELEYRRGRKTRSVELTCSRVELSGPENLAARAARRLLEATGSAGVIRLRLEKRIPVGAGLGGGSSDAAAVLLGLGSLLRPQPDWELLHRVAEDLGSDVPFFLVGGRALGTGRGTDVYPLADIAERWLVVAAPGVEVSTAEAYRRLSPSLTTASYDDKIDRFYSSFSALEPGPGGLARNFRVGLENDFEPVVFRMHPELEKLKARLERLGARPALLCGSGSALFGMFSGREQALRARNSLELEDGCCFVVKTVSRTGYYARWRKWLNENERSH